MNTKSKNLAYFSDGHTEAITEFEISKDGNSVWFTVESGRWFGYREGLIRYDVDLQRCQHECKFYAPVIHREHDEFGTKCEVEYVVTDEIEKIKICTVG